MKLTQAVHRAVQINGGGTATLCGNREHSWQVFADRIGRFASALSALGVVPGDRVAMLALNSDRYAEFYYASLWIGAVAVPVNTRWSDAEIRFSLQDSEPSVLLFDAHFRDRIETMRSEGLPIGQYIFSDDGEPPLWAKAHDELIALNAPAEDRGIGGNALAAIMYTGGTTGFPKGVMLSHAGLASNAFATMPEFGMNDRSVYLHAAPMFHLADAMMLFSTTLAAGTHVMQPAFAPAATIDLLASAGVTHCLLVPTMIRMLLDEIENRPADLSLWERLIYGASPMPEATLLRALKLLPSTGLVQAFGQTELSPVATLLGVEQHRTDGRRLLSAGRAVPGVDLKIADETGRELPRGDVGEVWVRGPNTMLGYWRRPDTTAETLIDGWVRMGDAARMDDDGFIYVVERIKDMIISGGENVYSAEVENAILRHDAIAECAVIGVPDEQWGERVHAVVVPKPGIDVTGEAVIEHCRSLIAPYKCPRTVELRDTPLPLSGAGKILKIELRKPYWTEGARGVG